MTKKAEREQRFKETEVTAQQLIASEKAAEKAKTLRLRQARLSAKASSEIRSGWNQRS
jgi:hypothetical protein